MYVCVYLCLFIYTYVNIWGLIVILFVDLFLYLKKFLYAGTLGVLHHKKSDFRGGSVCLSGSLDNLTLENSRVVQEDEEGDLLGLFCFL